MPFYVPSRYLGGTEVEHGYGFHPRSSEFYPGLDRKTILYRIVQQVLGETGRADRSDTGGWLRNGARLYIDIGDHPEYSTAETRNPFETALHEHAGAARLQKSIDQMQGDFGAPVAPVYLYRDNVDSLGSTYASHENHLVWRDVPVKSLHEYLPTFLVARMPFFGTGRFAAEESSSQVPFRITQRGEFFEYKIGNHSTRGRSLFHTKDEPHGSDRHFRRVHILPGDTNFCETTTALKNGVTGAALALIECGMVPDVVMDDPIGAKLTIDRDRSLRMSFQTNHGSMTALNVMEQYLDSTQKMLDRFGYECLGGRNSGERLMDLYASTFEALCHYRDHGNDKTEGAVNWLTKLGLGEQMAEEENFDLPSITKHNRGREDVESALSRLRALELALHGITKKSEAFRAKKGVHRFFSEDELEQAITQAPAGTRASVRADVIDLFGGNAVANWSIVKVPSGGDRLLGTNKDKTLKFNTPFFPTASAIASRKARGLQGRQLLEDLHDASIRLLKTPDSGPTEIPSPAPKPALSPERRAQMIADAGFELS